MAHSDSATSTQQTGLYHPQFPEHWDHCALYSLATWTNGLAFRDISFSPHGLPVIKIAEIKGGISGQTKFTEETFDESVRVTAGDLLFSWSGQPETSIDAFWWRGPDGWLNQHVFRVTPHEGVDISFLYYLLRYLNRNFVGIARNKQTTGLGHVTKRDLHQIEAARPQPDEQRAIAGVLGALDDKIEQNRRTALALERMARAIFRAWFVDFEPVNAKAEGSTAFPGMPQPVFDALPTRFVESAIGPVPEGWEVKALPSVCTLVSGGTPKRSEAAYWGGNVPWYSVKDAPGVGEIWVINTSERITDDGAANSAARVVPKGCTIISARGTVGKLAMAGMPMAFNQSCYGLLPADGRSSCYLHLLMQTAVTELQQRTHGSVFDTITRATFDGLLVTSPPTGFLEAFEIVVSPLFQLLLSSQHESSKLAEMRDYLLPKLLSGQVRVGDAHG
jgi:type I restriction enzyme S subunit